MSLASIIDHTLLRPDATHRDIARLCMEAKRYGFAAVCVLPTRVATAVKHLDGTTVAVCTVVGFPLGASEAAAKAEETRLALAQGATEIDTVVNVGAIKDGNWDEVERDIRAVLNRTRAAGAIIKVILEMALLTDAEKRHAAALCKELGVAFVKTSTGNVPNGGATVEDVALLRKAVGPEMGIKASGGIRTREQAEALVKAGATRLGTSSGVAIVNAPAPPLSTGPRC